LGFRLNERWFCIFEFSVKPKVSASLARNLAKPENVGGFFGTKIARQNMSILNSD